MSRPDTSTPPHPIRVRLPFQSEAEFVERYAPYVSRGGILVATKVVKPEGTPVRFEFLLSSGARLLLGEGVVQRILQDATGVPSSMTLRFSRLDAASKAVVERAATRRAQVRAETLERAAAKAKGRDGEGAADSRDDAMGGEGSVAHVATASPPGHPSDAGGKEPLSGSRRAAARSSDVAPSPATAGHGEEDALFATRRHFVPRRKTLEIELPPPPAAKVQEELTLGLTLHEEPWGVVLTGEDAQSAQQPFVPPVTGQSPDAQASVKEQLSQRLDALAAAVVQRAGQLPSRVAFALPPDASQTHRALLRELTHAAGLGRPVLVHIPSAVALAFAHGKGFLRKRMLVLHLSSRSLGLVELQGNDVMAIAHAAVPPAEGAPSPEAGGVAEPGAATWGDAALDPAPWLATAEALLRSQRGNTRLDGILVSGDAQAGAALRARLAAWQGEKVPLTDVPGTAAETGAALVGQAITRAASGKPAARLSEVGVLPLLLARGGERPQPAIEASVRLPVERGFHYRLEPGTPVTLALFEHPPGRALDYVGTFTLESATAGEATLTLRVHSDSVVVATAALPSGRKVELALSFAPLPDGFLPADAPLPAATASVPATQKAGVFAGLKGLLRRK